MKSFVLGQNLLEDGEQPLFLPEIGTFFNKDISLAKEMITQLAEAGIHVIKGEVLHDADIALNDDLEEIYYAKDGCKRTERYRELIERKVVPLSEYEKVFELCKNVGLEFVLSVYDAKGAEFAKAIGACALKIASSNIVHQPLIEHVSNLSIPLIIDTGKSTLEEIARAMQWAEDAGATDIMIQHSPEAYPAPIENHNMEMIRTFRKIFDRPVGLSDHYNGEEMLYVAIALGAHSVEKGVYPDTLKSEQDINHAMPISKMADVLDKCNQIYRALGQSMRYLKRDREKYISRMGICASKDISEGDLVSINNTQFSFPATGIPVEHWEIVNGWQIRVDIAAGNPISWCDIEPPTP
ncbi:MAG: spore coat protein [Proteobacteria bacterium]|nr:spore coat protein [Pseudomonadota bacterium]NOG59067.1 spore coat protein [Pseudomonadota bacterium]